MTPIRAGVLAWGIIGAGLGGFVLFAIFTGYPTKAYERIVASAAIIGPILAALALVWSWFFQTSVRISESEKIADLSKKIDILLERTKLPNKAMETTPVAVTIPAAQEVAPSTSVSHL